MKPLKIIRFSGWKWKNFGITLIMAILILISCSITPADGQFLPKFGLSYSRELKFVRAFCMDLISAPN